MSVSLEDLSHDEKIARRKDQLKKAQEKYKEKNRLLLNEKSRIRRVNNLEAYAKRMRAYRSKNPDVIKAIESRRIRPEGFREKFNAYRKNWAKLNPEKLREYSHKRSGVRLKRLPAGTIISIGDKQRWRCVGCRCDLKVSGYHKDHRVPLAMGGSHSYENIDLLCPSCNLSKGKKSPIAFMQSKGKLL